MTTIFTSMKNITGDVWWLPKLIVLSIPIYLVLTSKLQKENMLAIVLFVSIFYLGCASFMMYRILNNEETVLPSLFDIPEFLIRALCMSLISIPMYLLCLYCIDLIQKNVVFELPVMAVIYICAVMFFTPFIFIPAVLYCVRGNLKDALNLRILFTGGGNFALQIMSFVLQYIFTLGLLIFLIYKLLTSMLNDILALNIFYSISIVFSFLTLYSYCADMYDEVIPPLKS